MQIIPAILPKDWNELEERVEMVKGLSPLIQVDICDGRFVPSFTWPYKKHDQNFEAILREERGLPAWEDLEYEIDLMVDAPEETVMQWVTAGATRIIIHVESTKHLQAVLKQIGNLVEVGLAINIDTPNEALDEVMNDEHADQVKFIQCMGIAKIGFQGQDFDERVLNKITELKKKYPNILISVDGGVNLETAPKLKAVGVDRLVVGSAIFGTENPVEAIHRFEEI